MKNIVTSVPAEHKELLDILAEIMASDYLITFEKDKGRNQMTKAFQCAIYARCRSANQRETSIEDQIRKCHEAALSK